MDRQERISLCIIARDEERNLARCLASAAGGVDEIVVVDTGSRDNTVAVAQSYGARVFSFPWRDDFAAARNHALEQATGAWVLVLDADEEMTPEAREALRPLVAEAGPEVEGFGFSMASWTGEREGKLLSAIVHPRLWRNRPQYRYRGRIHEWVEIGPVRFTGLRIYHYGYLRSTGRRREKAARNMALLGEELRRDPDNGYYIFQLGVEHSRLGQMPKAIALFRRAWRLTKGPFIAERFALCLLRMRWFREARTLLEEALSLWPDYTDLHYHQGCALMGLGDCHGAREAFRRCLEMGQPPPEYPMLEGHHSFMAWTQLGHVEALLHNWADAVGACWQALLVRPDYTPAVELLIPSLVALAGPAGALQVIGEQIRMEPQAVPVVARQFARWGCRQEALALFAQAGRLKPADRILRAQCLLAVGEVREAEAELDLALADLKPGASEWREAVVTRCQAAWLRDDPSAAAAALDLLERSRFRADAAVLRSFHRRLVGGEESPLPGPGLAAEVRLLSLAERLLAFGRPDLAERAVALLTPSANPVAVPGALGRILLRFGRPREARPYLEGALRHWGSRRRQLPLTGGARCDLLSDLGQVLLSAGEHAGAGQAYRKVLEREPDRLVAHLGLAESLIREAARLVPAERRPAYHSLAEAMRHERDRPEPVYDRQERGAQPAPSPR